MADTRPPISGQPGTMSPARPPGMMPAAPARAPIPHIQPGRPGIAPVPVQTARPTEAELEPLSLVEESGDLTPAAAQNKPKIKAFGPDFARKEHQWKRTPNLTGKGATRVKSFHGKYSDQGIEHLDDMVNEWLDSHPEVEVKFVTSTVNVFEGKIREPALVLNMWY